MNLYELEMYRNHKDHEMRKGHLSKSDREMSNPARYGFLNQEDKQYHSPERPEIMEGEY